MGRSQRRQHGRHDHTGLVTGLAERGFVVFDNVGQRHRRDDPHAPVGRLHMVGNFGFFHVEGQRLFQPEADHAFGFVPFGGQGLEIEQHDSDGGIGQHGNHVPRTPADTAQGVAEGFVHRVGLPQVGFDQVGDHAAGGEVARGAPFQSASTALGNPARQHAVSRNFTSQLRPGSGIGSTAHEYVVILQVKRGPGCNCNNRKGTGLSRKSSVFSCQLNPGVSTWDFLTTED